MEVIVPCGENSSIFLIFVVSMKRAKLANEVHTKEDNAMKEVGGTYVVPCAVV
jgi:hypothetical protein